MSFISFEHKGDLSKTEKFLNDLKNRAFYKNLDRYAKIGVTALSEATPIDSGKTALSWDYSIKVDKNSASITWVNSNVNDGQNIAILIQYGHGTGTGGYVRGVDYINPAMKPVFEEIANAIWKEVTKL